MALSHLGAIRSWVLGTRQTPNFHAKVAGGFIYFGPIAIPIVAATIFSVLVEYLLYCRLARGPGSAGNGEDAGIVADADLEHSTLP